MISTELLSAVLGYTVTTVTFRLEGDSISNFPVAVIWAGTTIPIRINR